MKKFSLWAYKHPFTVGLLTGGFAFFILVLTDMTSISICIIAIAITVMLIGMRQNSQRYQALHKDAKTILIPTITTPWPSKDDLPETPDIPPKLAVDKDDEDEEEAERINRLRYHHANDDPTGRWVEIGEDVVFLPYSGRKGSKPK